MQCIYLCFISLSPHLFISLCHLIYPLSSPVPTPTPPVKDWPTPVQNYDNLHQKINKSLYPHWTRPNLPTSPSDSRPCTYFLKSRFIPTPLLICTLQVYHHVCGPESLDALHSSTPLAPLAPLKVFTNSDSSPTRLASSVQPIFSYATIISKPRVPSLQYVPNPLHSCNFPLRYCNLSFGLTLFRTAFRI